MRRHPASAVFQVLAVIVAIYIVISYTAYGFRHPEKTDTQRFLDTWAAMTWQ